MKLLKNCILKARYQRAKYYGHQKCHVVWQVVSTLSRQKLAMKESRILFALNFKQPAPRERLGKHF